ncbi:MAG: prenyltransferase/squalene oxidase repeat-containing protein [Verrucomicrobiota bacterium]|nr:prenyltransferase/squalene oxidase repeat-containing protein [Verrucomicrobiota bacterium]
MQKLISLTILFCFAAVFGQDNEENSLDVGNPFKPDKVDKAIERGIGFLMKKQRGDGAILDRGHDTTMTALSLMAMAAVGHQPINPDDKGRMMRKALDFVLQEDRQDENGYFGKKDNGRMYGHGIITLMLSEMLGMGMDDEGDRLILKRCESAIGLILRSQAVPKSTSHQGGWRYSPDSRDADLSVTIWQLMALRSAKNAGLKVPSSAIEEAIGYLRRSYWSSLDERGEPLRKVSGFAYQPGGHPDYATTAAGLLAMQVCGQYESPFVKGAADWLLEHEPQKQKKFFFYGTYYYAQGMYQRGEEHSTTAREKVESLLLGMQKGSGSWQGSGSEAGHGEVYSTTMAILALAVKYHYLPIYQR